MLSPLGEGEKEKKYDISKFTKSNTSNTILKICCSIVAQYNEIPNVKITNKRYNIDKKYGKFILVMSLDNNSSEEENTLNQLKKLKTYLGAIPNFASESILSYITDQPANFDNYKKSIDNIISNIESISLFNLIVLLDPILITKEKKSLLKSLCESEDGSVLKMTKSLLDTEINETKSQLENNNHNEGLNENKITTAILVSIYCDHLISQYGRYDKYYNKTEIPSYLKGFCVDAVLRNVPKSTKYDDPNYSKTLFIYTTLITCYILSHKPGEDENKEKNRNYYRILFCRPDFEEEIIPINKQLIKSTYIFKKIDRFNARRLYSTIDFALELYTKQIHNQESKKDNLRTNTETQEEKSDDLNNISQPLLYTGKVKNLEIPIK